MVSAIAVENVRPGLRIALRRARPPAVPPSFSAGRPRTETSRRTMRPTKPGRPTSRLAQDRDGSDAGGAARPGSGRPAW